MSGVLLLTGPCGSGKSTLAGLVATHRGWVHISEDEIWQNLYGKSRKSPDRSPGSEQFAKILDVVGSQILTLVASGKSIALDFLVTTTSAIELWSYVDFLKQHKIGHVIRVLRPTLCDLIARDKERSCWTIGPEGLQKIYLRQSQMQIPNDCIIDNSSETPELTYQRNFADLTF